MSNNPPRFSAEKAEPQNRDGGFTLIELLVVMVILGIVASIAVFAAINAEPPSARAACQTSFKTVETAAEAYRAQIGHYPTQLTDLTGQTPGLNGGMDGPWLRDPPNAYTPGATPSITNGGIFGVAIDSSTQSIAVGTIKANGALGDTGTPLEDGDANCTQA
jgi:prepilin-type N-terminal cleavage/methylation domain-containing protein